jgi:phage head maturation protease
LHPDDRDALTLLAEISGDPRDYLRRLVKRHNATSGQSVMQVETDAPVIEVRGDADSITVMASDGSEDRCRDIIDPYGWETAAFETRNPVMLVDHDYRVESICGVWKNPRTVNGQFLLDGFPDPAETNKTADMVRSRLRNGSLRSTSVGFRPLVTEHILDDDGDWAGGVRFKRQELLENSFVAVPAHPGAGVMAFSSPSADSPEEPQGDDPGRASAQDVLERLVSRVALGRLAEHVRRS